MRQFNSFLPKILATKIGYGAYLKYEEFHSTEFCRALHIILGLLKILNKCPEMCRFQLIYLLH